MATVNASMTWLVFETRVRSSVGVPVGDDDRLKGLFASAKNAADQWLANPFTDSDGVDIPIPGGIYDGFDTAAVVEGVMSWISSMYKSTGVTGPDPNVTSVRIGDNSIGYAGSAATRNEPGKIAMQAASSSWAPFRCSLWR